MRSSVRLLPAATLLFSSGGAGRRAVRRRLLQRQDRDGRGEHRTGGGYDAMARAIARHIGKHIPGNPTVVVRNMPGAGGITAVNWLYNAAEKDGTVLGLVQNGTPLEPLFGTKEARYDAPSSTGSARRASRSAWCCSGTRCR